MTLQPAGSQDIHGHTSAKVLDIVDRSVRDSCANAVSVSVMMLSKSGNRRICNISVASAGELKKWEGEANKTLRSIDEFEAWAIDQRAGGFMRHLNAMVKALVDPAVPKNISHKRRRCAARMADTSNVQAMGHAGGSWRGLGRPLKVSSTVCHSSGRKSTPMTVSSPIKSSGSPRKLPRDGLWAQAWTGACAE